MGNQIAVIGINCRAPGAGDYKSLWSALREGHISVGPWPKSRQGLSRIWSDAILQSADLNKRVEPAMVGGYLPDVDKFDAGLFGISAREANAIDPQHRLILEAVWTAIQDASIDPRSLAGSNTGVYVGISTFDYAFLAHELAGRTNAYSGLGAAKSLAANRISHVLDLRGPSFALDSACSSALVGVHLACTALREQECDLALVAASNLILSPSANYSFANARMLSPTGECHPFRTRANGYVRSEGVGAVVLKRLDDAQRDGNFIHAVIAGSAINQDGRTPGITVPAVEAQIDVIRLAWKRAGVDSNNIAVVEAHGTGTPAGDRAELEALSSVFSQRSGHMAPCLIGAVKANIGHAEAAAGILSMIKLMGTLQSREVPPLVGSGKLAELPPGLAFASVPTSLRQRSATDALYGGVSAFGFGGTNAHIVLMGPPSPPQLPSNSIPVLITLSADKAEPLQQLRERWIEWIAASSPEQLSAAALSSNRAFAGEGWRLHVLAENTQQALERLGTVEPVNARQHPVYLCLGDAAGLSEGPLDLLSPEARSYIFSVRREQGGAHADQATQIALASLLRQVLPTAQILDNVSASWLQKFGNTPLDQGQAFVHMAEDGGHKADGWQTISLTLPANVHILAIGGVPAASAAALGIQLSAISPSRAQALEMLGHIWANGGDVRFATLAPPGTPGLHGIPAYPFCRQRYWLSPATSPAQSEGEVAILPKGLHESKQGSDDIPIDFGNIAYLREHRIGGTVVVPGASLVDLALTHVTERFGGADWQVAQVEFYIPVILDEGSIGPLLLRLKHSSTSGEANTVNFEFLTQGNEHSAARSCIRVHARGNLQAVQTVGEV